MPKIKIVHYINQFFANIGGEEMAHIGPEKRVGKVGPGLGLEKEFNGEGEIVATVICGDSYFNENLEKAKEEILDMISVEKPDLFISGPAFNAGRYGVACGEIAKLVSEKLNIPVITGMYIENPGVDMYRKDIFIVETKDSAVGMREALPKMVALIKKLYEKDKNIFPEKDGYIFRGIRKNYFNDRTGAERAVEMLVKKLKNEAFKTEYPMPVFDRVKPGKAIKDISKAKIALVTSGGIVPLGNPDRIEASSASKYGEYSIDNMGETAHGGYDPVYVNKDQNRVLPVDVFKELKDEGVIGDIYPYYYTTVGNGTSVASSDKFASEFTDKLLSAGVDGVVLTST